MIVDSEGIPYLSALKAVSAMYGCESLTPSSIPVSIVSCRCSSKKKLNYLSCSHMNPMVRIDTSFTLRSSLLMFEVIFYAIPGH